MSTNGREPEVIVNFADGYAYSKGKLEEIIRSGLFENTPPKAPKETYNAKKEDVDLIVSELEIPRVDAEKALCDQQGDVVKTLLLLMSPVKL